MHLLALRSQASTAGCPGMRNLMPEAQNEIVRAQITYLIEMA